MLSSRQQQASPCPLPAALSAFRGVHHLCVCDGPGAMAVATCPQLPGVACTSCDDKVAAVKANYSNQLSTAMHGACEGRGWHMSTYINHTLRVCSCSQCENLVRYASPPIVNLNPGEPAHAAPAAELRRQILQPAEADHRALGCARTSEQSSREKDPCARGGEAVSPVTRYRHASTGHTAIVEWH